MRRSRLGVGITLAAVLAVAGCSGSSGGTLPANGGTIAPNGQHYTYDEAVVAHSQWPGPCALLRRTSAATALETTVTRHRFHNNCYYVPDAASFPTLRVTLLAVGNQLADRYDSTLAQNSDSHPHGVDGVGEEASIYFVRGQAERRLDVLAGNALFELGLKAPVAGPVAPSRARAVLVSVGKVIAGEFSAG